MVTVSLLMTKESAMLSSATPGEGHWHGPEARIQALGLSLFYVYLLKLLILFIKFLQGKFLVCLK